MRLPADATLIVIDVQEAIDDPRWGPRNNPGAEANIAALIAAWRTEELPIIHVRHDFGRTGLALRAGLARTSVQGLRHAARGRARRRKDNQQRLRRHGPRGHARRTRRDDAGLCGVLTPNSLEATARHAGNLGYQAFVVADASWAVDKVDLRGRRWPAEDVHALSLAHLHGEYATVVATSATLGAAAAAKARQRLKAERASGGR